jgi:hypothetical protein
MEKMKIYYNDLFIDDANNTIEIYKNCQYDEVDADGIDEYVEEKFDWGEWHCYAIPEVCSYKIIYNI